MKGLVRSQPFPSPSAAARSPKPAVRKPGDVPCAAAMQLLQRHGASFACGACRLASSGAPSLLKRRPQPVSACSRQITH